MKTLIPPLLFAILLLITSCVSYHQNKGDDYYENLGYAKAIEHYEIVNNKKWDPHLELKLADSYVKTAQLDSAKSIYYRAIQRQDAHPDTYLELGKLLMNLGKHREAARYIRIYSQWYPKDKVAAMLLASCNSVSERFRDTTLYALHPIKKDEFVNAFSIVEYQNGVIFSADKTVFSGRKTSAWTGNSYLDLYYMEKDQNGNWMNPSLLKGDINGRLHEGPATFSEDGNTVYFTRSNYFKRKMNVNEDRENNLKIFKATLINNEWKNLEEFPFNSDDYSCGHPTLSEDGKTLFFVSDMPGGIGGTDLYKTTLINGTWSTPENLGASINTVGNEMFPYLHKDGALYFSSDAHNSLGGLDVFITYHNGNRWVQPENLNYPLNSTKDDFGFSLNGDDSSGFVSSSRASTDKLYSFEVFPPTFNLYGFAMKKGTEIPVRDVIIEITDANTGELIKMMSDENGKFKLRLKQETEYLLYCTKLGCFARTDKISTKGLKYSEDFFADFEVEEIVINKPIVLENIYYDFDKWFIRQDAALELDKLVKILKDNPTIDIEMGSHTDVRGNDQYNQILSDKRAKAAVDYLISKGIDPNRLTYKGYGEKVLVNHCKNDVHCTEEEHQKNRRTEFKVTEIH
jgi:outer membrane protein OmpA-like peptidoglycan-associated protein